jgi:hypothetical protein
MARPILKVKKRPNFLKQVKTKGNTWIVNTTTSSTPPSLVVETDYSDYSIYSELESLLLRKGYNPEIDILVLPENVSLELEHMISKTEALTVLGHILFMKVKHPALVTTRRFNVN